MLRERCRAERIRPEAGSNWLSKRVFLIVQNGYGRTINSQHGDELGSGEETAQISYSSLAEDGGLRWVLQDLPQVVQEGLGQSLNTEENICFTAICFPFWAVI